MSKEDSTNQHSRGGGVGALILIVFGITFLLNNFGYLSWNVWQLLWKAWPLLLILAGLQILIGRSRAMNLLISVIIVAAITFLVLYLLSTNNSNFDRYFNFRLPNLR